MKASHPIIHIHILMLTGKIWSMSIWMKTGAGILAEWICNVYIA